jgi:hypothetical protein
MKNPFSIGLDAPYPRFDYEYQYVGGEDVFGSPAPYFKPATPNCLEVVGPHNALEPIDYGNPTSQNITPFPDKFTRAHPSV